jgi:phosphonate transport system substrate-binding protein
VLRAKTDAPPRGPFRFGLPPTSPLGALALETLARLVRRLIPTDVEPIVLPSYAALSAAVSGGLCEAAWCPPLVALDLIACGAARPSAALERFGRTSYEAAIVAHARSPIADPAALSGARMGWIAPESASGHVVPRLHLAALGLAPATLFADERFLGSFPAAFEALARGEVDAIATYAHHDAARGGLVLPAEIPCPARVVTSTGPIPGDVIMIRGDVPAVMRQAFARGLVALPWEDGRPLREVMQMDRFVPVARSHFDALARLRARGERSSLPPAAPA